MRRILPCLALMTLTACGGDKGGTTLLGGAASVLGGNDHTCAQPAPSGSPEQVACHEAAKSACPIGTSPDRIDFSEEPVGQFFVRGYSCV